MEDNISKRLSALQQEFEKGQKQLEQLEIQKQSLHNTLLRISGAIQVLEELQEQAQSPEDETDT